MNESKARPAGFFAGGRIMAAPARALLRWSLVHLGGGMRRVLFAVLALMLLAALYVAASYHIVTGSTVSGVSFQKKMSMSFSETFVNLDSVGNMPMIVARAQYPMFVASMERGVAAVQKAVVKSCPDLALGMYRSEVLDLCGNPSHIDSVVPGEEIMHWDNGMMVKVQSGRITFVSR